MESCLPCSSSAATDVGLLPFPSVGHISPFLQLARVLADRGVNCTVILTHLFYSKLTKEDATSCCTTTKNGIQFAAIKEDEPPDSSTQKGSKGNLGNQALSGFTAANDAMMRMRTGFEEFLQKLPSLPRCLIADTHVIWSQESAHKFGLPRIAFYTCNAFAFCIVFHFPFLFSKGLVPFTDASYENHEYTVDCIPGLPPLRPVDFSNSMRHRPEFVLMVANQVKNDDAVLVNSTYELEKEPLDVLQKSIPVFTIGPLLLLSDERSSSANYFCSEETNCLNWLYSQPPASVLYVSFGSMAVMSAEQLIELAEGLEASQQRFLWVIRSDALRGSEPAILPEGFAERTKDRGLIISWAPQVQVLAHPSLGGFFTHCGWNSITENVSMKGVPMICWPHEAEQRLNCRQVVDIWNIGIEFSKREDGFVVKEEVERAVRALMQGEVGKLMKVRARQLRETVIQATEGGGSSFKCVETLVELIKSKPQRVS